MNGRCFVATVLLALVLAACGGDDTVKVEQTPAPPATGSNPMIPVTVALDKPARIMSVPIAQSAFLAVTSPTLADYHIWVLPRPSASWNDPQFQVFTDPAYMSLWATSFIACSFYCGPSQGEYYPMYGWANTWLIVYAQGPGQANLNYGVSVLSGAPTGTFAGSGSPSTAPGQLLSPGTQFNGSFVAGTTHYFQVPASKAGIHAFKVSNTALTWYYMDVFQDAGFSVTAGRCAGGYGATLTSSCVVDVPSLPATLYVTVRDSSSLAGSYTLSVIGP